MGEGARGRGGEGARVGRPQESRSTRQHAIMGSGSGSGSRACLPMAGDLNLHPLHNDVERNPEPCCQAFGHGASDQGRQGRFSHDIFDLFLAGVVDNEVG